MYNVEVKNATNFFPHLILSNAINTRKIFFRCRFPL